MDSIFILAAILAVVVILTVIGILSRYRKCKPDEVLVVYGKTGGREEVGKTLSWRSGICITNHTIV